MNHELWEQACARLAVYGETPPAACWSRLAAEEAMLQGTDAVQGFAVLGKIRKNAKMHNSVIVVGGTLNSSFTAWLFGATEVNPLPPHYLCTECGKMEFVGGARDGFDLPPKKCSCGHDYKKDGHRIPFEGYAKAERNGTHIEIHVSESFKPIALKVLLDFYDGVAKVLPVQVHGEDDAWTMERYVVLPTQKTKPKLADDGFWHIQSEEYWNWQENETTFTFFVSDQLNEIEELRQITGVEPPDPLELVSPQMAESIYQNRCNNLSYITEALVAETHDFDLLMRIDLLSHATGAWFENGQQLVREGRAKFRQIPAAREDIWNEVSSALTEKGIRDNGFALQVMEKTRKGLYCSQGIPENVERLLLSLKLPKWYPDYLKKVKYLFPKGHCIAYLLVDIIRQWYRINYPVVFAQVAEKHAT